MLDDESPEDMYRRLTALSVAMTDLGATHTDDIWVKRKFISAYLSVDEVRANTIKGRSDYRTMTSNDVLSEVVSMISSKKLADNTRARVQGARGGNLALKAKVMRNEVE
jgi:hypothetical protein